ncbi:MAG TPA: hypothetical protein VH518_01340 [Tepidisphaeraceae bacterium]|jgi:ElaB/YqjD/DUF883 family membrane-anchored ribosome-binding protein
MSASTTKPKVPKSEAEYLRQQAEHARQAISRTLHLMKQNLGHSVDPRALGRTHPWASMGVAAIGGFLLVNLIGRRPRRRRVEPVEERVAQFRSAPPSYAAAATTSSRSPFWGLLRIFLRTVRPIIVSAATAAVKTHMGSGQSSASNGQSDYSASQAPPDASSGGGVDPAGPYDTGPF